MLHCGARFDAVLLTRKRGMNLAQVATAAQEVLKTCRTRRKSSRVCGRSLISLISSIGFGRQVHWEHTRLDFGNNGCPGSLKSALTPMSNKSVYLRSRWIQEATMSCTAMLQIRYPTQCSLYLSLEASLMFSNLSEASVSHTQTSFSIFKAEVQPTRL